MNFLKYQIQTYNRENFWVQFSNGLECLIAVSPQEKMFHYEEKCHQAIKQAMKEQQIIFSLDPDLVIELSSDLWSKKYKPTLSN